MARPPKDPADVASIHVGLRLRPAVYDALKANAAALGISLSAFIVKAATQTPLPPPVPPVNLLFWQELSRLAGNLNQLTHLANAGGPVTVNPQELVMLAQLLRRVRQDLRGEPPLPPTP